jgi:hypothetical protein
MTGNSVPGNNSLTERRQRPIKGIVVIIDERWERAEQRARKLESYGYHAVTTRDVSEGVRMACCRSTVAIIADATSDTEDGWSQLRCLPPTTLILLLGCDPLAARTNVPRQLVCLEQYPSGGRLRALLDSACCVRD